MAKSRFLNKQFCSGVSGARSMDYTFSNPTKPGKGSLFLSGLGGLGTGLGVLAAVTGPAPALANPTGANVQHGSVTIEAAGKTMHIHQESQKAIVTWKTFSNHQGETIHFNQTHGSNALIVNKVLEAASTINGRITAPGRVWIINPRGIIFGPSAQIDIGGLVASTADSRNEDILSGKRLFDQPSPHQGAMVVNQGRISAASGGEVALIGAGVSNEGVIEAPNGRVSLVGAKAVALPLADEPLLALGAPVETLPEHPDGGKASALVSNSGRLDAVGGEVVAMAHGSAEAMSHAVNLGGEIRLGGAVRKGGKLYLVTQDGALIGGDVDASADASVSPEKDASETSEGGSIVISGKGPIEVTSSARLDVSGRNGAQGGQIEFGQIEFGQIEFGQIEFGTSAASDQAHQKARLPGPPPPKPDDITIAAGASLSANGDKGRIAAASSGNLQAGAHLLAQGGTVDLKASHDLFLTDAFLQADKIAVSADADVSSQAGDGSGGTLWIRESLLDASPDPAMAATDTPGGEIAVTGERVALLDGTILDASGPGGGGLIHIGGTYQGGPGLRTATHATVGPDVQIRADALVEGKGGRVILWSEGTTRFYGDISAKGGAMGGDGGFVETSGKIHLDARGSVDISSQHGLGGEWLLDPMTVNIVAGDDPTSTNAGWAGDIFSPTTDPSTVYINYLIDQLDNPTDTVTIQTTGGDPADVGDINIIDDIIIGEAQGKLVLDAADSIELYAGKSIIDNSTGTGISLEMNSGANSITLGGDITTKGDQTYNGQTNLSGSVTLTSLDGGITFSDTVTGNNGVTISATNTTSGTISLGGDIDATNDISLTQGAGDFTLTNTITSSAGAVTIDVQNGALDVQAQIDANTDLTLSANTDLTLQDTVRSGGTAILTASTGSIIDGGGTLDLATNTGNAVALRAGSEIGTSTEPISLAGSTSTTTTLAANAGSDVMLDVTSGDMTVGTVDGLSGASAGGTGDVAFNLGGGALVLAENVSVDNGGTVGFYNASSIDSSGGKIDLNGTNDGSVALEASGAINATVIAGSNDSSVLAAETSGAGSDVSLTVETADVTIGSVSLNTNTTTGLNSADGDISLDVQNGRLAINESATAGGDLALKANGTVTRADEADSLHAGTAGSGNTMTISARGAIAVGGDANMIADNLVLQSYSGTDGLVVGGAPIGNGAGISQTDTGYIAASTTLGQITFGNGTSEAIRIESGQPTFGQSLSIGGSSITLNDSIEATGSIALNGAGASPLLLGETGTGGKIVLTGPGGVSLAGLALDKANHLKVVSSGQASLTSISAVGDYALGNCGGDGCVVHIEAQSATLDNVNLESSDSWSAAWENNLIIDASTVTFNQIAVDYLDFSGRGTGSGIDIGYLRGTGKDPYPGDADYAIALANSFNLNSTSVNGKSDFGMFRDQFISPEYRVPATTRDPQYVINGMYWTDAGAFFVQPPIARGEFHLDPYSDIVPFEDLLLLFDDLDLLLADNPEAVRQAHRTARQLAQALARDISYFYVAQADNGNEESPFLATLSDRDKEGLSQLLRQAEGEGLDRDLALAAWLSTFLSLTRESIGQRMGGTGRMPKPWTQNPNYLGHSASRLLWRNLAMEFLKHQLLPKESDPGHTEQGPGMPENRIQPDIFNGPQILMPPLTLVGDPIHRPPRENSPYESSGPYGSTDFESALPLLPEADPLGVSLPNR